MLKKEEIPTGVIEELEKHFNTVSIDLDLGIDTNTKSLKSEYLEMGSTIEKATVVSDPLTFETIEVEGYLAQGYIVRLNEDDNNNASVRVVAETGLHVIKA